MVVNTGYQSDKEPGIPVPALSIKRGPTQRSQFSEIPTYPQILGLKKTKTRIFGALKTPLILENTEEHFGLKDIRFSVH